MGSIPLGITRYVRAHLVSELVMTYLHVGNDGKLVEWGGYPKHYGLPELVTQKPLVEQIPFFQGLLPITHTQVMEFVKIGKGRNAHVHLTPHPDGAWILFLDASQEHQRQRELTQQRNDLGIAFYQQTRLLSESEAAYRKLLEAYHRLEQLNLLRSRLIGLMANAIETPLEELSGYSELTDEVALLSRRTAPNITGLDTLLTQITEEARLAATRSSETASACHLPGFVDSLRAVFKPQLDTGVMLFQPDTDSLPKHVNIDEIRFNQVLVNLTTLALLQSTQVTLELSWAQDTLHFSLSCQNFIGVPANTLNLKFNEDVLNLLNGVLTTSEEDKQLTVTGSIPAGVSSTQYINPAFDFNGKTVLIAEDSFGLSRMIEIYLQENGYGVLLAENGEVALKLAELHKPDIILMDMQMPLMDGLEAAQTLRSRNFQKPIIAMSASMLSNDQESALAAGCDAYISKPIDPAILMNKIEMLLRQETH